MKCLVVDDEYANRLSYSRFLQALGFNNVVVAENAPQAIEIMKLQHFDFILTDNNMPGHDNGMEVVKAGREIFPSALIWMASGLHDEILAEKAIANGANACFCKIGVIPELKKLKPSVGTSDESKIAIK